MMVRRGSKPCCHRSYRAGYVFFLARSPEAPKTRTSRGCWMNKVGRQRIYEKLQKDETSSKKDSCHDRKKLPNSADIAWSTLTLSRQLLFGLTLNHSSDWTIWRISSCGDSKGSEQSIFLLGFDVASWLDWSWDIILAVYRFYTTRRLYLDENIADCRNKYSNQSQIQHAFCCRRFSAHHYYRISRRGKFSKWVSHRHLRDMTAKATSYWPPSYNNTRKVSNNDPTKLVGDNIILCASHPQCYK